MNERVREEAGGVWFVCAVLRGVALVLTETLTSRASRDAFPVTSPHRESELVVVLGFRPRRTRRTNFMQRWRTRIALRTVSLHGHLLFAGGAAGDGRSEASVMASYAIGRGFLPDRILTEEVSMTTWEKVSNNLPALRQVDVIAFASNSFHARRARRNLAEQAPDLVERLRPGRDFIWGELAPVTAGLFIYEQIRVRRR